MADKNVQIKFRNEQNEFDNIYPKTKIDLVEGLQTALDDKVDKVEGKQLSTEDYTTAEKDKLAGIEENANYYIHPATHDASMIVENENKRFVSDSKIAEWDAKQDALGYTPENTANKNIAGGYAGLDANAKIPLANLPDIAKSQTFVVTNPSDREALTEQMIGDRVYETATGDSYIWDGNSWLVLAKAEWENVNLQWGNIVDKPDSTTSQIDDAVNKRHEHNNKNILDKITASGTENSYDLSEFVKQDDLVNADLGDMLKAEYDTNNDGIVDHADLADSVPWNGITGKPSEFPPTSHTHHPTDIVETSEKMFVSNNEKNNWNNKSRVVISSTEPTEPDVDIWYQEI